MTSNDDLKTIAQLSFEYKQHLIKKGVNIIEGSIPILWFGNIRNYFNSPRKVITVALNPSKNEFLDNNKKNKSGTYSPSYRFDIESIDLHNPNWFETYEKSLNNYFERNPYTDWFKKLDPFLEVFGSHFGGKIDQRKVTENTAIHTDIAGPWATDPTFGGLDPDSQFRLIMVGHDIWKKLVDVLQPNVVIMSGNVVTRYLVEKFLPEKETNNCDKGKFTLKEALNSEKDLSQTNFSGNWNDKKLERASLYAYLSKNWNKNILVMLGKNSSIGPFGDWDNSIKKYFAIKVKQKWEKCLDM